MISRETENEVLSVHLRIEFYSVFDPERNGKTGKSMKRASKTKIKFNPYIYILK